MAATIIIRFEALGRKEEVILVDLPDMRYWKDLLNLLVLPMEGDPDANGMGFQSLNNGGYLKKGTRMRDVATDKRAMSSSTLLPHTPPLGAIQSTDDLDKALIKSAVEFPRRNPQGIW